jgi:hypothetical protein
MKNTEKLNHQVMNLEAKNKQLFEIYSQNEKKLMEILKKVKDENQSLLKNLKKLLTKSVINTEALINNPANQKFIQKLKEMKLSNQQLSKSDGPGGSLQSSQANIFQNEPDTRLCDQENTFILQELRKANDSRSWVNSLYYSKSVLQ